jgi:hypothetical protein
VRGDVALRLIFSNLELTDADVARCLDNVTATADELLAGGSRSSGSKR